MAVQQAFGMPLANLQGVNKDYAINWAYRSKREFDSGLPSEHAIVLTTPGMAFPIAHLNVVNADRGAQMEHARQVAVLNLSTPASWATILNESLDALSIEHVRLAHGSLPIHLGWLVNIGYADFNIGTEALEQIKHDWHTRHSHALAREIDKQLPLDSLLRIEKAVGQYLDWVCNFGNKEFELGGVETLIGVDSGDLVIPGGAWSAGVSPLALLPVSYAGMIDADKVAQTDWASHFEGREFNLRNIETLKQVESRDLVIPAGVWSGMIAPDLPIPVSHFSKAEFDKPTQLEWTRELEDVDFGIEYLGELQVIVPGIQLHHDWTTLIEAVTEKFRFDWQKEDLIVSSQYVFRIRKRPTEWIVRETKRD